jgi:hypothetical protein
VDGRPLHQAGHEPRVQGIVTLCSRRMSSGGRRVLFQQVKHRVCVNWLHGRRTCLLIPVRWVGTHGRGAAFSQVHSDAFCGVSTGDGELGGAWFCVLPLSYCVSHVWGAGRYWGHYG